MLRCALVTVAIFASTAAFAQGTDGGPVPARCGADLTDEGACYGSVLAWCDEPNAGGADVDAGVTAVDCAALTLDDEDLSGSCVVSAGVAACGVPAGAPCALPGDDGVVQLACLSSGVVEVGAACDVDQGCVSGAACSDDTPACEGDRLRLACAGFGQPLVVDCAAHGGTCAAGACTGVGEGGRCGAALLCAEGLSCVGASGGLGSCLSEAEPSTPVEPPDDDVPPPPASCSAQRASGSSATFGWLALLSVVALVGTTGNKRSNVRYRDVQTG